MENIFNQKISPKKSKKNGTVLRADQQETTSLHKQNVSFGKARTTRSKPQQVEQRLWPPPSIPTCEKEKDGIGSISVNKEAILPHNHFFFSSQWHDWSGWQDWSRPFCSAMSLAVWFLFDGEWHRARWLRFVGATIELSATRVCD